MDAKTMITQRISKSVIELWMIVNSMLPNQYMCYIYIVANGGLKKIKLSDFELPAQNAKEPGYFLSQKNVMQSDQKDWLREGYCPE